MSEAELIAALQTGWDAVDENADILITGEMGIGNTTAAAAIAAALFGGSLTIGLDAAQALMMRTGTQGRRRNTRTGREPRCNIGDRGAALFGGRELAPWQALGTCVR